MTLDLLKRAEKGSALNASEFDATLTAIENAINGLSGGAFVFPTDTWASIKAKLQAGGTVYFTPGTYNATTWELNTGLANPLRIIGAGKERVIIDHMYGPGNPANSPYNHNTAMFFFKNKLHVEGITFKRFGNVFVATDGNKPTLTAALPGSGLEFTSPIDGITFRDLEFERCRTCVYMFSENIPTPSAVPLISNLTIENVTVTICAGAFHLRLQSVRTVRILRCRGIGLTDVGTHTFTGSNDPSGLWKYLWLGQDENEGAGGQHFCGDWIVRDCVIDGIHCSAGSPSLAAPDVQGLRLTGATLGPVLVENNTIKNMTCVNPPSPATSFDCEALYNKCQNSMWRGNWVEDCNPAGSSEENAVGLKGSNPDEPNQAWGDGVIFENNTVIKNGTQTGQALTFFCDRTSIIGNRFIGSYGRTTSEDGAVCSNAGGVLDDVLVSDNLFDGNIQNAAGTIPDGGSERVLNMRATGTNIRILNNTFKNHRNSRTDANTVIIRANGAINLLVRGNKSTSHTPFSARTVTFFLIGSNGATNCVVQNNEVDSSHTLFMSTAGTAQLGRWRILDNDSAATTFLTLAGTPATDLFVSSPFISGSGTPFNVVTPAHVNQFYRRTSDNTLWWASDTTSGGWKQLST